MTTKINGTNTAANPAITGADTDTGLSFGTDTVNINTGGTTRATIDSSGALDVPTNFPIKVNGSEKLRIDSSGNLGLGTTSPASKLHVDGANSGGAIVTIHNTAGSSSSDAGLEVETSTTGAFTQRWLNAGTELARISGSGDGLIGCTSTDSNSSTGIRLLGHGAIHSTRSNEYAYVGRRSDSDGGLFLFRRGSGNVGSISVAESSTSFNTSSDYRLKENVTAISDGITRLKTLKPSRFNFKTNKDLTVDGFLAHEVTAVPEAVTGTKDAVATEDSEEAKKGDPIYQQIDQSKIVPLLTAALQEAVAKIEVLETKVAALEAG